jgi:hypothetical protein
MIVLSPNEEQYNLLNNYRNNNSILLFSKDGANKWVVGLTVLNDPNFAEIHDQLNELERIEYTPISARIMKLPITFEQFKSDPLKALFFAALVAMTALYVDSRNQMAKATEVCEKRLQMCEAKLDKLTKQLKTQDSLCSALVTEITIYKNLGKI